MNEKKQFGYIGLTAIVVGSMIGGGIFNLSKEIAETSSVGAAIIGWIISGAGVFFIAKTFQVLSDSVPEITDGIYKYAKVGFGKYAGFNAAWGYWVANVISNVSFAVLMVQTLNYFFPSIQGIRSVQGIIISSILIWTMTGIALSGGKVVNLTNNIATLGKIVAVLFAIIVVAMGFKYDIFTINFWGQGLDKGSVFAQVKGCMLQTLWVFIGIEGAVVISGRAKNSKDVGRATMSGYFIALFLYVMIVVLSYGILSENELANLKDPALSSIVESVMGPIGATLINIGVLISVGGAWISWTVLTAEIPYNVAQDGVFPSFLAKENNSGTNIGSLLTDGVMKQIIFLISLSASNAYLEITNSATSMMLIPYIFSGMFLIKISKKTSDKRGIIYGVLAVIYGIWMVYAAGLGYIIQSSILYSIGIIYMIMNSREKKIPLFDNRYEKIAFVAINCLGIYSLVDILMRYL